MADEYPTEEELERLRKWPVGDVNSALDYMRELWHWPDAVSDQVNSCEWYVCNRHRHDESAATDMLRFDTGGWSGNEALIDAFSDNGFAWAMTWMLSGRGGLYIFRKVKNG